MIVLFVVVYRHYVVNELINTAQDHNVELAQSLANTTWPRFSSYITSVAAEDGEELRSRPETQQIHETLAPLLVGLPVLRIKLHNLDGLTIYSSEPGQIGDDKSNDPGFITAARKGKPVSNLKRLDRRNAFGGRLGDLNLVESYIPIRRADGAIDGVFELHADVTPLMGRIDRVTKGLVAGLFLMLASICGALMLMVRRADHILVQQSEFQRSEADLKARNVALEHQVTERRFAEKSLRDAHHTLEQRVADRTFALEGENTERNRVEAKLRESEQRLIDAIESISEAFSLFDADDRLVLCNSKFREFLYYGVEDVVVPGTPFETLVRAAGEHGLVPVAEGRLDAWVAERMAEHRNPSGPQLRRRSSGRWFQINERKTQSGGTVAVYTDMTEHKKADQALRESEGRFRAVVNNSPTKIHIKDADGRYILVNREAEKLFGVTEEQARGKTTQEIFPEKTAASFVGHDQLVMETGQAIEEEEDWVREDGIHTYLTVKFPIFDAAGPGGHIIGVGAIGTDITERKRAEAALERLRRQYDMILRSAGEGIYGLDMQGKTTFVNPAAAKMIGWETEELIGKPQHDILHHTKPDGSPYPREECPIYAAFKDGRVHHATDDVFWRKDGTSFPVEYVSTPIQEDGRILGAVVTFSDISDRKKSEEALRDAKEQAELTNRSKSEFLANMSHELRTPLNAIIGFSDMIRGEMFGPVGSPKYVEYIDDINESGEHLLALISDILDLSKIEAGKLELYEEDVDVARTIRSCLTLVKERAGHGGLTLESQIPPELPALRADERKLKQILINLLSNAVKFTPAGGTVTIKSWLHPDDGYMCQVTDTGIGIALEDIPKALAPFKQIDSQLNRKYEGTGLGLPLTKSLVELHGGSLDLQSEVGVGTTVTVRFPAERIVLQAASAA